MLITCFVLKSFSLLEGSLIFETEIRVPVFLKVLVRDNAKEAFLLF